MKKATAAAKMQFDEHGYVRNRQKAVIENRKNGDALEERLTAYAETARRLHRLGFIHWVSVSNAVRQLKDFESGWRTGERMEIFEAKRKAEKTRNRAEKKALKA